MKNIALFISYIEPLWKSFYSVRWYRCAIELRLRRAVLFFLLLVSVSALPYAVQLHLSCKDFLADAPYLIAQAPPMKIAGGILSVDDNQADAIQDPVYIIRHKNGTTAAVIDPASYAAPAGCAGAALYVTGSFITMNVSSGIQSAIPLSLFDDRIVDQTFLKEWTVVIYRWAGFALFPFIALWLFCYRLIPVFICAIPAAVADRICKTGYGVRRMITLAVYASVPAIVLSALADGITGTNPVPLAGSVVITAIYTFSVYVFMLLKKRHATAEKDTKGNADE